MMPPDTTRKASSRRRFIDLLLWASGLAWLASLVYPALRFVAPVAGPGIAGPRRVSDAEREAATTGRFFSILPWGTRRLILFQGPDERLRSLSAICTHEGCTVQYLAREAIVWCACHNGRFDLDGRVISGPPPRPLAQYALHEDESGALFVRSDEA